APLDHFVPGPVLVRPHGRRVSAARLPAARPRLRVSVPAVPYVGGMLIDCETCCMRGTDACDDCVVSVILGSTPVEIDDSERAALDTLGALGLCRLRGLLPQAG